MRHNLSSLLAGTTLLLLSACSAKPKPETPVAISTVTIDAHEFAFGMPSTIPAGVTRIQVVNTGTLLHHVQLMKLSGGHKADELAKAFAGGPPPDWATPVGGPNGVEPGDTTKVIQTLEPGTYAAICFIPIPDVPHFAKGMVTGFEVVAATGATAAEPASDFTIRMSDYAFSVPAPIAGGQRIVRVENAGPQEHELVLARLAEGKTLADLMAWAGGTTFTAPPPAKFVGGVVGMLPDTHVFLDVNLTPGNYVLLCFVPDAKDGKPHLAHGMISEFQVPGA